MGDFTLDNLKKKNQPNVLAVLESRPDARECEIGTYINC